MVWRTAEDDWSWRFEEGRDSLGRVVSRRVVGGGEESLRQVFGGGWVGVLGCRVHQEGRRV